MPCTATAGVNHLPILDLVVLNASSSDLSEPTSSVSLNMKPPAHMYPRTCRIYRILGHIAGMQWCVDGDPCYMMHAGLRVCQCWGHW